MTILQGGNVGIGITAPISKLHVAGSASALTDYALSTFETAGSNGCGLTIGYDTTNNWTWLYSRTYGIAGRPINLNNALFVNSGGTYYVGVGTTVPQSKLHIGNSGAGDRTQGIYLNGTANTDYRHYIYTNGNYMIIDANGDTDLRQGQGAPNRTGSGYIQFYTGLGTDSGGSGASTEKSASHQLVT